MTIDPWHWHSSWWKFWHNWFSEIFLCSSREANWTFLDLPIRPISQWIMLSSSSLYPPAPWTPWLLYDSNGEVCRWYHSSRSHLEQWWVFYHHPTMSLLSVPAEKIWPKNGRSGPVLTGSDRECTFWVTALVMHHQETESLTWPGCAFSWQSCCLWSSPCRYDCRAECARLWLMHPTWLMTCSFSFPLRSSIDTSRPELPSWETVSLLKQ